MKDTEVLKKEIGKRLKTCRLAKKLSQDKLSEKIGMEPRSYSNIETGARLFSIEVLLKLMSELDVSADYILKGYTNDNSPINTLLKEMSPDNIARAELILQTFYDAIENNGQ